MPSPSEVAAFQALIAQLADAATSDVSALVESSEWAELVESYPELLDPYIAAAGQLTAEWYQSLSPTPFAVEVAAPPPKSALASNVRWALTQQDPVGAVVGSAERQVFTASRETVLENARREKVRFARYASANACSWCRVLATRDPVYYSAENALKGHDNCHCMAVPVRSGDTYEPPEYVNRWRDEYAAARDEVGGNLNDITNYLRRTT